MRNVDIKINEKTQVMTIMVDLKAEGQKSKVRTMPDGTVKGGKSIVIATTQGNQSVTPDGLKVGLNVYRAA